MGDRVVAVIPSRFGSTRFPGKPLADIDGLPMVVRVARRVERSRRVSQVIVATDDARIAKVVRTANIDVVLTPECASGTDRVARAIEMTGLDADLVVNVQGDEPAIDPEDIDALIETTLASPMGTLARPFLDTARVSDPNVVKVVVDAAGRALAFSRSPLPKALMHVGLYAYDPSVLLMLSRTPPTPLEQAERLEQLRALEIGVSIQVAMCRSKRPSAAVDVPEDVERVVALIRGVESHVEA